MRVRRAGGQAGRPADAFLSRDRAAAPEPGPPTCPPAHLPVGPSARLAAALAAVRRLLGMPDYAAHLAHLRAHHPDCPVPTEREFYDQYLRTRYGDGAT